MGGHDPSEQQTSEVSDRLWGGSYSHSLWHVQTTRQGYPKTDPANSQGTYPKYMLPVSGEFTGSLRLGDREIKQTVYVVHNLLKPLLGQPAIEALKLLVRIGTVARKSDQVQYSTFLSYLMVSERCKRSTPSN